MKKSIIGFCLCLSITGLAAASTQQVFASETTQTSGTKLTQDAGISSADISIKNVKEKLFDLIVDASEELADDTSNASANAASEELEEDTLDASANDASGELEDFVSVASADDSEDLASDAPGELITEDSEDDLQEDSNEDSELELRDSYSYLVEGMSDTDDPSEHNEDLREALEALEEKMESEGVLSASSALTGIWGEANELSIREEMVQFALQFVGNPYVWGGTSLTNGADCSGFVLAVHNHFGYALPRVAADQYAASRKKDISALEPGDLVFYGSGISHVAMYIGDGQIVHAANSRLGIIVSDITWMNPVGGGTFLD